MKKIVALLLPLILAGCTTSSIIDRQIHTGVFTFWKSNDPGHDFDVKLELTRDFNWTVANKEDRLMIIKKMLGNACINPIILNEQYISRGKSAFGVENGSYLIKVACQ